MFKYLVLIIFMAICLGAISIGIIVAPDYAYKYLLEGKYETHWYKMPKHKNNLMKPSRYPYSLQENLSAENLWKEFHIKDVIIPMPFRHPLYRIIPILKSGPKKDFEMGFTFLNSRGDKIAEIHFLPNSLFNYSTRGQEIFELPISKAIIRNKSSQIIWSDLFSREIKDWGIDYNEMIYNLFIINLRSDVIPPNALSYGNVGQQDVGIVKLSPKDKDFNAELVMTMKQNVIYSYFLMTKLDDPEAVELRDRFLHKIKFERGNSSIAAISYQEFKALPITRQTDTEGMIYLLSAWSNWDKKAQLLKELIYFMEKGEMKKQLKPIYEYAYKVYGNTFSTREDLLSDNPMLRLQKKIELEDERRIREAQDSENQPFEDPGLQRPQTLEEKLKSAKERKKGVQE